MGEMYLMEQKEKNEFKWKHNRFHKLFLLLENVLQFFNDRYYGTTVCFVDATYLWLRCDRFHLCQTIERLLDIQLRLPPSNRLQLTTFWCDRFSLIIIAFHSTLKVKLKVYLTHNSS